MPMWNNMMFQSSVSPLMEQLMYFHDHTMIILILIFSVVSSTFIMLFTSPYSNLMMSEGQELESIWTILPAVILILIAMPSLQLLYMMDELNKPMLTLKTMAHQWYWSYEYSDFKSISFNSFMLKNNLSSSFRLLDVDNRVIIPTLSQIRILISSADVLHAWTIPSLGCSVDAIPGRLNQLSVKILQPGILYGQCSEICGANHSFMPIVMESIPTTKFMSWVMEKQ